MCSMSKRYTPAERDILEMNNRRIVVDEIIDGSVVAYSKYDIAEEKLLGLFVLPVDMFVALVRAEKPTITRV